MNYLEYIYIYQNINIFLIILISYNVIHYIKKSFLNSFLNVCWIGLSLMVSIINLQYIQKQIQEVIFDASKY